MTAFKLPANRSGLPSVRCGMQPALCPQAGTDGEGTGGAVGSQEAPAGSAAAAPKNVRWRDSEAQEGGISSQDPGVHALGGRRPWRSDGDKHTSSRADECVFGQG
jgi:hypothetical protein